MSAAAWLVGAVLSAGVAAAVGLAPRPSLPGGHPLSGSSSSTGAQAAALPQGPARWRWWAAGSALLGGVVLVPGPLAVPISVGAAVVVWMLAARAEPASVRRSRALAQRQLPHLVELFGAALAAGSAPGPALDRVCTALPGPAADLLRPTRAALGLGLPPAQAWAELAGDPVLAPLGRALVRAHDSGAPVVDVVRALADDLAAEARLGVEDRARTVGVRAAVPLGLCLLPAFLLLGIVPLVAAAVSAIDW